MKVKIIDSLRFAVTYKSTYENSNLRENEYVCFNFCCYSIVIYINHTEAISNRSQD